MSPARRAAVLWRRKRDLDRNPPCATATVGMKHVRSSIRSSRILVAGAFAVAATACTAIAGLSGDYEEGLIPDGELDAASDTPAPTATTPPAKKDAAKPDEDAGDAAAAYAPPSCTALAKKCGPTGDMDCCATAMVPGGTDRKSVV